MTGTAIDYPQKRNGNMPRVPDQRNPIWESLMKSHGMTAIQKTKPIPLGRRSPMHGVCMTCWATSVNWYRTGMALTITRKVPRPIPQVQRSPNAAAFLVAVVVVASGGNADRVAAVRMVLRPLRMDRRNLQMDLRRFRTGRRLVEAHEAVSVVEAVDRM